MNKLLLSVIILTITYILIFTQRRFRTTAAFLGGLVAVTLGLIGFHQATANIDFNKLAIFLGMMIFTIITKESGIFQYLAIKVTKFSKGNTLLLLIALSLLSAFLSSILDEIITLLLLANLTLAITNILEISSLPFLIAEIISANLGGMATYIGTPVNIMIGSSAKFNFIEFLSHLAPISFILMTISILYLANYFRNIFKENKTSKELISHLNRIDEKRAILNPYLFKSSLLIFTITIIFSFFAHLIHLELGIIYLLGALVMLLISKQDPDQIYAQVDWKIIFFLIGLNILAGTLEENGLIKIITSRLVPLVTKNFSLFSSYTLIFSGLLSSFFDNIPLVAIASPVVKNMSYLQETTNINLLWWILALGANIGANGTLIGSASNLIVADIAEKNKQPIPFWHFIKVSMPLVIINLFIAWLYVYLRYL
ncbi:MAG: ArsB/NhaD family transporter [Candidatus Caldatribacteriota bacterium]